MRSGEKDGLLTTRHAHSHQEPSGSGQPGEATNLEWIPLGPSPGEAPLVWERGAMKPGLSTWVSAGSLLSSWVAYPFQPQCLHLSEAVW